MFFFILFICFFLGLGHFGHTLNVNISPFWIVMTGFIALMVNMSVREGQILYHLTLLVGWVCLFWGILLFFQHHFHWVVLFLSFPPITIFTNVSRIL
ncbi:MAG: hypothetical protein HZA36_00165 [Parcubacteria group bacterium]|nr:hypothetical protein [Parcubacteria group bacterium]